MRPSNRVITCAPWPRLASEEESAGAGAAEEEEGRESVGGAGVPNNDIHRQGAKDDARLWNRRCTPMHADARRYGYGHSCRGVICVYRRPSAAILPFGARGRRGEGQSRAGAEPVLA